MDTIYEYEHPFVCTDAVVFTIKTHAPDSYRKLPETSLRVLLYRRDTPPYQDEWCLPGGFLRIDELPEDNIRRQLSVKTDVSGCWLEQLYTFCDLDRDPRARVLSIAYLGLMNERESMEFTGKTTWFTACFTANGPLTLQNDDCVLSESDFGFDHCDMIKVALARLQSKILYTGIIFNLLPEEFTLTQLQNVYETILGKKDQAANFRRKIMHSVRETGRYIGDKGHRPAKLYTKKSESC